MAAPLPTGLFLLLAAAAFAADDARIVRQGDSVAVSTPSIDVAMVKSRNFCPVMNARDASGQNFNFLMMTKLWYHGRTGNADCFYQDQDEHQWASTGLDTSGGRVEARTESADWDVTRLVTPEPDDVDAVRLEYVLRAKESRFYDPISFPLLYFSPEITSVSYDDGTLAAFRTAAAPTAAQMVGARALLLHIPDRGKTVAVLADVNFPLALGRPLGVHFTHSDAGWARTVSLGQLWYDEWPFFVRDEQIGVRLWFKVLDGGEPTDAQFAAVRALADAVGAEPAQYSSAHFDADYARPSALAAALAAPDGLSLWTETPMHRVYPQMAAPTAANDAVRLESCRNERESFQLVLRPAAERTLTGVAFSDFVSAAGARIPAANARADRLGYETVADVRAVWCGATRFADRMIPLRSTCDERLPADENTVLHLTVFTPPTCAPGEYRGEVTLSFDRGTAHVPVALTVWDVVLPAKSAYTAHMLMWNSPYAQRENLIRRFVECGLSPTLYTGAGAPQVNACFNGTTLKMPDDFALAEKAVKELGMSVFQVPWAFMGAWDWEPGKTVFLNLDIDSERFDTVFRNFLTEVHGQLAAKGLAEKSFLYMWDEMTAGHYPAMIKTTQMVRTYAPGVRILTVSAPDPEVVANNDIIVAAHPAHWWSADAKRRVAEARAAGKEIWLYANAVTFGTTSRALVPRLTPWLGHAMGGSGYLHWSADYNWAADNFAENGKEWLVYPSSGEQIYSVRTEYFRDGVEDFNLMKLIERLPSAKRSALEARIAAAVSTEAALTLDPALIRDIRRTVAAAVTEPLLAAYSEANDLGAFENERNDFWDTTAHGRVRVNRSLPADVAMPAVGFDSRLATSDLSDTPIEIRRHTPPPTIILLR